MQSGGDHGLRPDQLVDFGGRIPDLGQHFAAVLSEQRRRARIRLELAATYYQQANYAVALQELRQALEIDPNYAQALGMLGLVNMDLGENARAEESFQRALQLNPRDGDTLLVALRPSDG